MAVFPYQVPIVIPLIVVLASIYLVIAPFYEAPLGSLYCVIFILAGIPFYLIFVRFSHVVPKWFFSGIGMFKIDSFVFKYRVLLEWFCSLFNPKQK